MITDGSISSADTGYWLYPYDDSRVRLSCLLCACREAMQDACIYACMVIVISLA